MQFPSKSISKLDLSNHNLKTFPLEILKLKNLKKLILRDNQIKTIPPEIIQLKHLEHLDLSSNNISNFYAKICGLKKLKTLNFNNNLLKSIPTQIKNLNNLQVLLLANNKISSLPNELSLLKKIKKLNIANNEIQEFPKEILNLKDLRSLWINNLPLQSFPVNEIVKHKNLKSIYCFGINNSKAVGNRVYDHFRNNKGNCFQELKHWYGRTNNSQNLSINNKSINTLKKNKIFISYSHDDKKWLQLIQTNLKVLSFEDIDFQVWDDTLIKPGDKWKKEIEQALNSSGIAILIISTKFLASDFIRNNELPPILKNAEEKGTLIIPIIVGHSRFSKVNSISQFQALNNPESPLNTQSEAEVEKTLVNLVNVVENHLI